MKYIGKYKGNVGTTHGTLVSGLVGYYNRIINLSKYILLGGHFNLAYPDGTTTSGVLMNKTIRLNFDPTVEIDYDYVVEDVNNLFWDKRNGIPFAQTYNGTTYSTNFNGTENYIKVEVDNSNKVDSYYDVVKISRSGKKSQMDYVNLGTPNLQPGETRILSFWYSGQYGTGILGYTNISQCRVSWWNGSAWVGGSGDREIAQVPLYTWTQVKFKIQNVGSTAASSIKWLVLHWTPANYANLATGTYWKMTKFEYYDPNTPPVRTSTPVPVVVADDTIDYTWNNTIPLTGLSPIKGTYNGTTVVDEQHYDGSGNNIVVSIDNSDQPFSESDVIKINRLNSGISQMERIYPTALIKNGETKEFSFWYKGTYGTSIIVSNFSGQNVPIKYWNGSSWVGTTNYYIVPVTTNEWQQIRIRGTNTSGIDKQYINYIDLHQNVLNTTLNNTENWKITLLRDIDVTFEANIYSFQQDKTTKKIYAGGAKELNGGVIRLNPDGTKDETFNIGTGFDNSIEEISFDKVNQKIYVGGYFTTFNGSTQNYLVRLNADGSKDTSFDIGSGANVTIFGLYYDKTNQKIYVGGNFTSFNGATQNRLIRLNYNGTKDTTFNIGTGFNDAVRALYYDNTNQKIYVGGYFNQFQGVAQNRIIKLNYDGSKDTTFIPQVNDGIRTIIPIEIE